MSITVIINQMIILFILIGLGFFLNKVHLLGGELDSRITKLILYVTLPTMMINSVLSGGAKDKSAVIRFLVIAIAMYVVLPILAYPLNILMRVPKQSRGLYMFMVIFGNVGFMGFPFVAALFGDDSVLYAGIFNMIFNFLAYSYGVMIVSKDGQLAQGNEGKKFKLSAKQFLTPGITMSILALVIYFVGIEAPGFVKTPVAYIGNMTTPLAMMMIGSTLANMNAKEVFTDIRVYIFVLVRCFLLPLALCPIIKLCIPDLFMQEFTFIMLIMPVANSAVLYAKEYGGDDKLAARCVFLSTLFAIVTIPVLVAICF